LKNVVISLKNVSYSYNAGSPIEKKALQTVNLKIFQGEITGIIGSTGSGKTTLGKIMAGLIQPQSGSVITPGLGIGKVGLVFQFPEHQIFCRTVFHDITYPVREIKKLQEHDIEAAYITACNKVNLDADAVRNINPMKLSAGEKRRVAIAGVLIMEPQVMIFDEPTAGLDRTGKDSILDEIKRLSDDGGTVIIVSHYIEELLNITDRMVLVENGNIAADGNIKDIINRLSKNNEKLSMLPAVTELMVRLKSKGLNVGTDIVDPERAFMEIKKVLNN